MKKDLLPLFLSLSLLALIFLPYSEKKEANNNIEQLRAKHEKFLKNSPFKETLALSKEVRKALGIPPNKYYERQWELSMNPALGYPEPHKVLELQKNLKNPKTNLAYRVPGDAADNQWTERGPDNVGGRTRVVFFDPNDAANLRVFAGGVSGGLWVTDNISVNGGWTQVSGVPGNLNVSCYAIDPNDSNTWYIGTGEQYSFGAAVGNGVYRTTDGGLTWTNVPVQLAGIGNLGSPSFYYPAGIFYINDIVARDNGGSTELYLAVGADYYNDAVNPYNMLGSQSAGLYRSTDNGVTWTRNENPIFQFEFFSFDYYYIPSDLEIAADNTLWMGTTATSNLNFDGGGRVFSSPDGVNWTQEFQVVNGRRTEIETSATDPNKIYVLAQTTGIPEMYVTTTAFALPSTAITLPNDPDGSIPANDFTRGQAFYDLVVEADPVNDDIVYIGGVNLHRSTDSGASWTTISHWDTFYSDVGSLVHADQHALNFRPGSPNQAVLGHDGGVSFADDLSAVGNNLTAIYDVDEGYNTVQFYHLGVAPSTFPPETFLGGTQDNGTPYFYDPNLLGPDAMQFDISGGDGGYSFFDQIATDYLIFNNIYNNRIVLFDFSQGAYRTIASNGNSEGDFINPQALDSNLDLLYSNGATAAVNQIFRYEGLTNLMDGVQAVRTVLTDPLLDAPASALAVSPHNPAQTNLLVGTDNSRLLSVTNADNAGINWTEITGPSFLGSVSDVEFGQTENDIFVTFHNYGVINIWYSDDGGTTWQNKEGNLPDMPVKCILQNPLNPDEVIIGTELGVWRTGDFSAVAPVWIQSYNGMSDVKVTSLELRDDNMVFASTFGRGLFSGEFTMAPLSSENPEAIAKELTVYPTVSDGEINITSTLNLGETQLNIYNIQGQKVYSATENIAVNSVNTLQLQTLSSGIYLLNFNTGTQKFTKKFVIR